MAIGRTAWVAAVAVALAAGLPGCSSDDPAPAASPPETAPSTAPAPEPEQFTGPVDAFYEVPDPVPEGEPGDLIRVQEIGSVEDRVTLRIMYRSTDQTGADRAVTGVVTYPTGPVPDGGWPVISTAHGTSGIAAPCAPSRTVEEAPGWGVEGVRAMTDYIGLGPVGEVHPYLSKAAEGNAMIDIVRAARLIPDSGAGDRWISIGHSQGGHGALSAHELAADRAPELRLAATVALSPAAMLDRVYGGIDPIVTAILTMMSLSGGRGQYPGVELGDYVTPEALATSEAFETGCLDEIIEAVAPVAAAGAFTADPRRTEPARAAILDNDVGEVAVDDVPVFLASGTADDRVVIERVRDLFDRMCDAGQVTELTVVDGADHGAIVPATADAVTAFIDDALAGRPPTDSCG